MNNIIADLYNLNRKAILRFLKKHDSVLVRYFKSADKNEKAKIKLGLYNLSGVVRRIVDGKMSGEITREDILQIQNLTQQVTPSFIVLKGGADISDKIDLKKGSYEFTLNKESLLNLNLLKYQVFSETLLFLNGDIVVRLCVAEDCKQAFVPVTLKQVYCSKRCKWRIAKQKAEHTK